MNKRAALLASVLALTTAWVLTSMSRPVPVETFKPTVRQPEYATRIMKRPRLQVLEPAPFSERFPAPPPPKVRPAPIVEDITRIPEKADEAPQVKRKYKRTKKYRKRWKRSRR